MLLQQWQGTAKVLPPLPQCFMFDQAQELTTLIGPEIPKIVGLVACLLQHTHKTRTKAAEGRPSLRRPHLSSSDRFVGFPCKDNVK